MDPYSGVLYHETPLTLMFMEKISRRFPGRINNMFLLFDVLTAYLFGCIASSIGKRILKVQEKNRKKYVSPKYIILRWEDFLVMSGFGFQVS